jgi:hypothetical protein
MNVAPIAIPTLSTPDFSTHAKADESTLRVALIGSADVRVMGDMKSLLDSVHREVLQRRLTDVVVDMRQLEFMNSSCFKTFVSWLLDVQDAATPYRIRFVSDPGKHWQKRSLTALWNVADQVVRIED